MRISEQQRQIIKQTICKYFGVDSQVRLFGSRADDNTRGGDVDIYIEPQIQDVDDIVDAKLDTLVALHQLLGEQKIDLVINRKMGITLPIYDIAKDTGIPL